MCVSFVLFVCFFYLLRVFVCLFVCCFSFYMANKIMLFVCLFVLSLITNDDFRTHDKLF